MPYIYIDDGHPDAKDFDSNYLFYDENDLDDMERVLEYLEGRIARDQPQLLPVRNALSKSIEERRRTDERRGLDEGERRPGLINAIEMRMHRLVHAVSSWITWSSQPST